MSEEKEIFIRNPDYVTLKNNGDTFLIIVKTGNIVRSFSVDVSTHLRNRKGVRQSFYLKEFPVMDLENL